MQIQSHIARMIFFSFTGGHTIVSTEDMTWEDPPAMAMYAIGTLLSISQLQGIAILSYEE